MGKDCGAADQVDTNSTDGLRPEAMQVNRLDAAAAAAVVAAKEVAV